VSKGTANDGQFIERAFSSIRQVMEGDDLDAAYHRFILPETASVRFAKALDRSVNGSMIDMIRHATYWLAAGEISPFDVGRGLNEIPMSAPHSSWGFRGIGRVFGERGN